MNICFLSTTHNPLDSRLFHREACSLSKFHSIKIIAISQTGPIGNFNNVRFFPIPPPKHKIFHFITIFKVLFAGIACNADVYVCMEPGSLFSGVIIKKIKKKYLFYDGHEYFPELFADNTVFPQLIRPIVIKIMESIEKILARHADIVITVDPYLKERYLKYNDNVYIFPNYPILQVFTNEMANQSGNGLIYIGYLKLEKGLHQILQAAVQSKTQITCVGPYASNFDRDKIEKFIKENPNLDITIVGNIRHAEVKRYISLSRIGMVLLQPVDRHLHVVPVKLFEYMACGKPVIASNFPDISAIIKRERNGITVNPVDVEEITQAIKFLLHNPEEANKMGINGRKAIEQYYNWERIEQEFIELFSLFTTKYEEEQPSNY